MLAAIQKITTTLKKIAEFSEILHAVSDILKFAADRFEKINKKEDVK